MFIQAPVDLLGVDDLSSVSQSAYASDVELGGQDSQTRAVAAIRFAQGVVRTYCSGNMLTVGQSKETSNFPAAFGARLSSAGFIAAKNPQYRPYDVAVALRQKPVRSVQSVQVDGVDADWYLDDANQIRLAPIHGSIVEITYSHGYDDTDPRLDSARLVTARLAIRIYTNPAMRAAYSNGEYNYSGVADTPAKLLTNDEKLVLGDLCDLGVG